MELNLIIGDATGTCSVAATARTIAIVGHHFVPVIDADWKLRRARSKVACESDASRLGFAHAIQGDAGHGLRAQFLLLGPRWFERAFLTGNSLRRTV